MMMKKTVWKSKQFQFPPSTYMHISQHFLAFFTSITEGTFKAWIIQDFYSTTA